MHAMGCGCATAALRNPMTCPSDANLPPLGELCAAYTHPRKDNEETAEFRRCLQWALVDMAKKSYDKEGDATKFWYVTHESINTPQF